jgi:site-specific recombinase XerD
MRVGELVSLRLKDWREDDQSFVVQGKGDRQRLAILPDDRSVAAVQAYLPKRRALQVGQDALLLNAAGRPLSTQGVARVLDRFAHQAGVPTHVTPHMIRHTVATLLLRHGADIRVVQEVLGHTSITTTQRYTHVSKEHLMETLRAHHPSRHMSVTTSALGIPA